MSLGRRSYNVLRGYINREWERIKSVDLDRAEDELQEAIDAPAPLKKDAPAAETEEFAVLHNEEHARRLLGVGEKASFDEIRKSFERLNKRSDPTNFPPGSPEAIQAADIQKRVNWAYSLLIEKVDMTERRFKSLEIE